MFLNVDPERMLLRPWSDNNLSEAILFYLCCRTCTPVLSGLVAFVTLWAVLLRLRWSAVTS